MKMIKHIICAILLCAPSIASSCWYNLPQYNNFIYSVNDIVRMSSGVEPQTKHLTYALTNNIVADFPLTVTMKLVSDTPLTMQLVDGQTSTLNIDAQLQYRMLPDGEWVTVSRYTIDTGRLPASYPPAPYLGRNNIMPPNMKKGDKVMIRLYVTDGAWQSGDPASLCDANRPGYSYPIYQMTNITYVVTAHSVVPDYSMGGGWQPQYVVVVENSGKAKPVQ